MHWLSVRLSVAAGAALTIVGSLVAPSTAPVTDVADLQLLASATDEPPHRAGHRFHRLDPAQQVMARMSLPQRVGQLFMVGTPATSASPATLRQIGRFHVGNVMLTGRSYRGVRVPARVAAAMQARATAHATGNVRLLVSTDQEGGQVQALHGRGFSTMPSALTQGRWTPHRLERAAGVWARQLRAAA